MPEPSCNDKAPFSPGEHVEVLLPRPFDHGFDYRVPPGMMLCAGAYVGVPFGGRELPGVVLGEGRGDVADDKCKDIARHCGHLPPMTQAMRGFLDWVAAYTLSPRGMVLKMALPVPAAVLEPPTETVYRRSGAVAGRAGPARAAVLQRLAEVEATRAELLELASPAVLSAMLRAGLIEQNERIVQAAPMPCAPSPAPPLRAEQQAAAQRLRQQAGGGFRVTLLEGVTGSGKTEVYFDTIEQLLTQSTGQILVLLPEIALTLQWMQRFEQRFGAAATLWHSSVSPGRRRAAWHGIATGAARLVVGARSALFLPFRDLRLIVVDEEHEPSYKQEDGVLYHARDMAVSRAKHETIPVVLCSATPSLETICNVRQGKYTHLQLKERHGDYHEPIPELIDLRADRPEPGSWLSPPLREAVAQTLAAGHQAMLYLNRRGYAPLLLCRGCGYRFQCSRCSAWMVQHQRPPRLQCHHCDARLPLPAHCPECGSEDLAACGPGVERIAEEAEAVFPAARQAVLSSDMRELSAQLEAILRGEAALIIGTQMAAKGHHFPKLALVGVIDGDIGLEGGDLRAGERQYHLLHQLAGRAGREAASGRVLLQTAQPEHPLMQALAAGDRDGFLAGELAQREAGGWPPFTRLAGLLLEGMDEAALQEAARTLMRSAPRYGELSYLGPAPAPMARRQNRYRYRILVKAPRRIDLQRILRDWLAQTPLPRSVRLKVDIDPYSFM